MEIRPLLHAHVDKESATVHTDDGLGVEMVTRGIQGAIAAIAAIAPRHPEGPCREPPNFAPSCSADTWKTLVVPYSALSF